MENNIYASDFIKRLYTLRQMKGATAREMSLSIGKAHNYIHSLESEKSFPQMLNFFYICEFLGVTPKQFFDYEKENPMLENELYTELMKLDVKSQEHFLKLLKEYKNRP